MNQFLYQTQQDHLCYSLFLRHYSGFLGMSQTLRYQLILQDGLLPRKHHQTQPSDRKYRDRHHLGMINHMCFRVELQSSPWCLRLVPTSSASQKFCYILTLEYFANTYTFSFLKFILNINQRKHLFILHHLTLINHLLIK